MQAAYARTVGSSRKRRTPAATPNRRWAAVTSRSMARLSPPAAKKPVPGAGGAPRIPAHSSARAASVAVPVAGAVSGAVPGADADARSAAVAAGSGSASASARPSAATSTLPFAVSGHASTRSARCGIA